MKADTFAKLVVLKKILPNYAENPKFVRLFLDEAKLVAQMEHPHIAQVYDLDLAPPLFERLAEAAEPLRRPTPATSPS